MELRPFGGTGGRARVVTKMAGLAVVRLTGVESRPEQCPPRRLVAAAAAALVLAAPSRAVSAVTLGPADLSKPGDVGYGCQEGLTGTCCFVHLPGAAFTAAAPSNGVITRWRFRAGCCVPAQTAVRTLKLRVFSQTFSYPPYNSVRAVRTGPSFVVQPGGTLGAETLVDVPVRLRIDAGQLVGVDTQYPFDFNGFGGNQLLLFQPPPADGAEAYGNTFGERPRPARIVCSAPPVAVHPAAGWCWGGRSSPSRPAPRRRCASGSTARLSGCSPGSARAGS